MLLLLVFLYLNKTYNNFCKTYDITHFYFHNIDRTNFIRIHNRYKHSDFIDRVTLLKATKASGYVSGVEFGINHNLTLRVVTPLFYKENTWFLDVWEPQGARKVTLRACGTSQECVQ